MRVRSTKLSLFLSASVVVGFFVACSSSDPHPGTAGDIDGGGAGLEASIRLDGASEGGDSGLCTSGKLDGTESDVDCGGTDGCARCALGKKCLVAQDCETGADCVNKQCAICTDKKTDGDETDVDCGGKACGKCTVGKRCKVGSDCRSGTCTADSCACPKDMTIISLATGGAYCIDQAEVSKGQYNKFITANVPVNTQTGSCLTANTTFVPRAAWPPATSPPASAGAVASVTLAFNYGLPVHYVDWCDAAAYCKWANKELCGLINGGTLPLASSGDQEKSAWYNACSAQGVRSYPYAGAFDNSRCNTDGTGVSGAETPGAERTTGFGFAVNQDGNIYDVATSDATGSITSAAHQACQGGSTGVYQMSGNVAEWEDSCDGTTATANCRVRGGSYADSSGNQTCLATRDVVRMPPPVADPLTDPLRDVGFRCCQY
jgi:formylglycine-generating enzyme required for sulfatase activity